MNTTHSQEETSEASYKQTEKTILIHFIHFTNLLLRWLRRMLWSLFSVAVTVSSSGESS